MGRHRAAPPDRRSNSVMLWRRVLAASTCRVICASTSPGERLAPIVRDALLDTARLITTTRTHRNE